MCFSASTSLVLSSALFYIGSLTLAKVRKPEDKWFAYIPVLFGIQQLSEGIIWLTYKSRPNITLFFAYVFAFIAFVVWPSWIPYAVYAKERLYNYKRTLYWFFILGLAISSYFLFTLIKYGVDAKVLCDHIYYHLSTYNISYFDFTILYLIPTIIPFFITTTDRMKILGSLLIISCLISYLYWYFFFASIWCFFAAFLSLIIYFII